MDARRSPLRDVEHGRHDLEFSNRFTGEARLAKAGARRLLRDLLAVEIELEHVVGIDARPVSHVVGGDSLDHLRQLHPVAALDRKIFHLPAIDVAGDLGR